MSAWWQMLAAFLARLGLRWLDRTDKTAKERKISNQHQAGMDVANHDADAVNRRTEDARVRLKMPAVLFALGALSLGALSLAGCATRASSSAPMAIEADRAVYPTVSTNGVSGWFVPDATMKLYQRACQLVIDSDR